MEDQNMNQNLGQEPEAVHETSGAGQQAGSQAGQQSSQAAQQQGQELINELTVLADKFAAVVRTAWNSEQRKQIETDVKTGLSNMATSLEDGFKQVASSNEAKDLQAKAGEVGEKVTSSKFFADLTGALTVGLRSLSDQLDKVSKDLQAKNAAGKSTGATASGSTGATAAKDSDVQDIPISKE